MVAVVVSWLRALVVLKTRHIQGSRHVTSVEAQSPHVAMRYIPHAPSESGSAASCHPDRPTTGAVHQLFTTRVTSVLDRFWRDISSIFKVLATEFSKLSAFILIPRTAVSPFYRSFSLSKKFVLMKIVLNELKLLPELCFVCEMIAGAWWEWNSGQRFVANAV
ncbi:hypothetical protein TNCV_4784921 [Trichonephila clavipes]|nr:hypothetical protein TNCV_4784921 [Trichonephila clavipes]